MASGNRPASGDTGSRSRRQSRVRFLQLVHDVSHDPDFVIFVAIDSETDHLPLGRVRELWSPDVLMEKDRELAAYELRVKKEALAACQVLITRFGHTSDFHE